MKKRKLTPFGVEVKKALMDKQMTQVELAKFLGTSPKYISLILCGERSGKKYLGLIVELLNIETAA